MILVVVWVVLMILWLFGGGYVHYTGPTPNTGYFVGGTIIPWLCVAIIGYLVLNWDVGPARIR